MQDILKLLNKEQRQAVESDTKYLLILAGAGTGKTRAITSRIIYLIKERKINPANILAVTFTNKAANEMKERVIKHIHDGMEPMIKTFHSFGAYILRIESFVSGRNKNFQIYDTNDSKKVISEIIKKFDYSKSETDKIYKWIQNFKQQVEDYDAIKYKNKTYKEIFSEYNNYLLKSNCFDFEDLILEPYKIFSKYPEILSKYQKRFKHILVDEYQDTNRSQFELLKVLSGKDSNVMVVGDEDQSIYKFRGADINNILSFEKNFSDAKIIRMEENYRSTENILITANSIIKNNLSRLGKNLFTNLKVGNKVLFFEAYNDFDEAEKILYLIEKYNMKLNNTAILYRTNNQSRPFEQVFNREKIPYIVLGSITFFEREEIKDAISILKWIVNPKDRIAFSRFVNKPSRGIGEKTLLSFFNELDTHDDIFDVLKNIKNRKSISNKARDSFFKLYEIFKDKDNLIESESIDKLLSYYLHELNLWEYYEQKDFNEQSEKINNITEFIKSLEKRGRGIDELITLLEELTLVTSTDEDKSYSNKIKLMTVHNAKGLEFENVFVAGLEEGLFPHANSIEEEDFEEERRLFYVAITRAKNNLTVSYCSKRNLFGVDNYQEPSQFLTELPEEILDRNCFGYFQEKSHKSLDYAVGDIVRHKDYGNGKIIMLKYERGKNLIMIDFFDHSIMEFILEYTDLEKVT